MASAVFSGSLLAQAAAQPAPAARDPQPAAQSLAPGANSFVESQARAAIAAKGFENVSPLVNDSQGIWRGTATRHGEQVQVSVDYKGHVDAR
ncbi:hypothetical protein [Rhodopseudomonas palustris]